MEDRKNNCGLLILFTFVFGVLLGLLVSPESGEKNRLKLKYKTNELKEVGIVQFMDSVKRLQTYESVTALMKGMYSGFIDTSKINMQTDLNWLKDLNE